jgi:hypothetical protein
MRVAFVALVFVVASGCSDAAPVDQALDAAAASADARTDTGTDAQETDVAQPVDAASEASTACSVDGNPGQCITTTACATLADHTSTPGYCPGPADIECCVMTPNVADNPPIPAGYKLMAQADVTPAMTTWAVSILNDPTDYPMFATAMQTFGSLDVLARVEWHPPDFQNSVVHRGVTLYEPV